jgi:hypothetical protein
MLNRLVYFSERSCDDAALTAILPRAAEKNRALGVTGLLLADDRSFIQILEGPRASVSAVFQQISQDRRHSGVVLVEMTEIAALSYPRWGMAYVNDPAKVEAAWRRMMPQRTEPWPLNAFQLRGLLKIALGDAVAGAPAMVAA